MNKRLLSSALALCMVGSMLPAAALAAETGPSAIGMTVMGEAAQPDGPALKTTIGNGTPVSLDGISLVASEAVDFQVQDGYGSAQDVIYVSAAADGSATLTARIAAGSSGEIQTASISLTSGDDVTWTGSGSGFTGVSVGALANELGNRAITIPAGGMVSQADSSSSPEAVLRANQDAENTYLYLYPADLEEYTISFVVGANTYTFVQPAGTELFAPLGLELSGSTLMWYSDPDFEEEAQVSGAASQDVTFYGKYTAEAGATSFDDALTKLLDGDTSGLIDGALPISDTEDFGAFVVRAAEVPAGQLVRLQDNITLTGTYTAISGFKGDFDGDNHTITGGTFTAAGDNAGMFATLGAYNGRGQRVANLTLESITVNASSADYAGILVGNSSGSETSEDKMVLIRNVQVKDSEVSARSAGGIAGFAIWTSIRFCSSDELTNVTCTVNGGGIAGISYGRIRDCYSRATIDSTLPIFYTIGGIVGKNLESGVVEHCWTPLDKVSGQNSQATAQDNETGVLARSPSNDSFAAKGMGAPYWNTGAGFSHGFTDAVFFDEWGV